MTDLFRPPTDDDFDMTPGTGPWWTVGLGTLIAAVVASTVLLIAGLDFA